MPISSTREAPPLPLHPSTALESPARATSDRTPATPDEPSAFHRVLHGIGREVERGEATMRGALGAGATTSALGPGALLALQAGVYRYSEAVDLAAKLVDRASSGVRTVVQGQS